MKRRDLFRLGAKKAANLVTEAALGAVAATTKNLIRPPFAIDETSFAQTCTRCDDCIEACSYGVLFKLSKGNAWGEEGTPAMDLLNKGCHLCDGWPCVKACEPGTLIMSDEAPKLALVQIDPDHCLPYAGPECGACAHSCPVPGALEWQGGTKPVIEQSKCTGCALCREACITEPKSVLIAPPIRQGSDARSPE
jgi:ferredoxin-type protein NapG